MRLGTGLALPILRGVNGPALSLPFASMATGSDLSSRGVTFTRLGLATQYDSTGKLTWAPNNLVKWAQDFSNITWLNDVNALSVTTGIADPDGGTAASQWTNIVQFDGKRQVPSITPGQSYIWSVYIRVVSGNTALNLNTTFNGSGLVSRPIAASSTWARYSVAFTAGASDTTVEVHIQDRNASGQGTIQVYGAQLEAVTYQTTPRPYVATTSAAYYGPRFDYDPATLAAKGLLIEEARTNLVLQSQDQTNAAWPKTSVTATAAQASPDGANSACRITEFSGAGTFNIYQTITKAGSSLTYTFSAYVRANGRRLQVGMDDFSGNGAQVCFDLVGAQIGVGPITYGTGWSGLSATITSVGNGWYRIMLTATSNAGTTIRPYFALDNATGTAAQNNSYTGDGSSGFYLFGAQLEQASFATSYIPTTSASVTRAAETASMTGTAFSSWYNQSEGTFVVDVSTVAGFAPINGTFFEVASDTRNTGNLYQMVHQGGARKVQIYDAGFTNLVILSPAQSSSEKFAFAYKNTNSAAVSNGGAVATDATKSYASTLTKIGIGKPVDSGEHIGQMWIKSLTYYRTRKDNASLQLLTAPNLAAALALDLDFTTGVLDPRITFTRSGGAMVTDNTGKLTWAPENALLQSKLASGWSTQTNVTLTPNSVAGPDGTTTAATVSWASAATGVGVFQTLTAFGGGANTIRSIYVRADVAGGTVEIADPGLTQNVGVFTLTTSWQRIYVLDPANTSNSNRGIWLRKTASSPATVYVADAQLERVTYQTTPRAYLPTTSAAVYMPRFDCDAAGVAKGLLIEESRTNSVPVSEDFTNAIYTKQNLTVTGNSGVSPTGVTNASLLIPSTGNTSHNLVPNTSSGLTGGANYTWSVYAKSAGYNFLAFRIDDGAANGGKLTVNLSDGSVTTTYAAVGTSTIGTASVTSVGNGWYRITMPFANAATTARIIPYVSNVNTDGWSPAAYTGDGTSGIYFWGLQLEQGAFATSYIPTISASVTRAADSAIITGSNFSSWWNASAGTFVAEWQTTTPLGQFRAALGGTNIIWSWRRGDSTPTDKIGVRFVSPTSSLDSSLIYVPGTVIKHAVAFSGGIIAQSANGGAVTNGSMTPDSQTSLRLGDYDNSVTINGWVRRIRFENVRASDTQLQQLTA